MNDDKKPCKRRPSANFTFLTDHTHSKKGFFAAAISAVKPSSFCTSGLTSLANNNTNNKSLKYFERMWK